MRSETVGSLRCGAQWRHKYFPQTEKTCLQCIGSKTGCGALVGARCPLRAQLAANWERRVMEVVESFPCSLLLLAKDRHRDGLLRQEDRSRRDCRWRGQEIEHARCTGEFCPVPFQLICDMGRVWNTDVQEIEGCNNTMQHISKLAPSMSWMLRSARVMTKNLIALLPTRAAKSEFSVWR